MDLKGIIAITGMSGLYRVVAQAKNGFIVESLKDKKRLPINASQKISALEDISVYTQEEDVPLTEVLKKMKETNGGNVNVDAKADTKALNDYFKTVLPNFDQDRVYSSDIKKIINWYLLLKDNVNFEAATEEASKPEDEKVAAAVKSVKKEKAAVGPKPESKVRAESKKAAPAKLRKKV